SLDGIPCPKEQKRLPVVLSFEEATQLFNACRTLDWRNDRSTRHSAASHRKKSVDQTALVDVTVPVRVRQAKAVLIRGTAHSEHSAFSPTSITSSNTVLFW